MTIIIVMTNYNYYKRIKQNWPEKFRFYTEIFPTSQPHKLHSNFGGSVHHHHF